SRSARASPRGPGYDRSCRSLAGWRHSYESPDFARTLDIAHAAPADLRMLRIAADIGPALPAADTFRVRRGLYRNPHPAPSGVGGGRCIGRRRSLEAMNAGVRRDEEETELVAQRVEPCVLLRHAVDVDLGIERRTDGARVTQLLELARDIATQLQQGGPLDISGGDLRSRMPGREKHRLGALAGQEPPDLLRREGEDRRQPADDALRDVIHHGLRRAARAAGLRRGVHAVLEHIEIEAAQVHAAEVVLLLIDEVEGVAPVGLDDLRLQRSGARERPAVEREQLTGGYRIAPRIEAVQVAEKIA